MGVDLHKIPVAGAAPAENSASVETVASPEAASEEPLGDLSPNPHDVPFDKLPERFRKPTTAPIDFRFPTTNQTRHCWTRYNEFLLCARDKSPADPDCLKLQHFFRSICPSAWIEKWNDDRLEGRFPGVQFTGDLEE